ncbi:SRPBCC family protein [Aciditerrimonas ferrireducens]|uniref:SRPBCC family protein n=1 Tax=Aciditerrimonas ferrireducens TaxID=667306 RepID=UPI002004CD76|nr:SRPBCC family protein [Aciditerrimonas ferrireducens]MCK4177783.1 SRPBCC family protein [Aciditerrimonas ferrireducens]
MSAPVISRTRVVAAPPEAVFAVLADPRRHPLIDGSGSVRGVTRGPERLSLGARFGMEMRIGVPYRITNTVVEFEEPRRIAWRHFGGHVWRYELEPVPEGTKVTETFDGRPSKAPWLLRLMGVERTHPTAIEATLDRLAALVEGGLVEDSQAGEAADQRPDAAGSDRST